MRFRCLFKHRALHYKPAVACRIINSCVVLHNMCIEYNVPMPGNYEDDDEFDFGIILNEDPHDVENPVRRVNPELAAGRQARERLIRSFFLNN